MWTNQMRLEFAVDLAQRKLTDIRPSALRTLQKKLDGFFGEAHSVGGIIANPILSKVPLPENYAIGDFAALQRDVKGVLADVVKGKTSKIHSPESFDVRLQLSPPTMWRKGGRSVTFVHGSTRDIFVLKLCLLLGEKPARILKCKAPDCDLIFYRHRRQEFCSTKCTNRTFMRHLRTFDSYRESEKEKAHERYEKRVKREVARRPQKKRKATAVGG